MGESSSEEESSDSSSSEDGGGVSLGVAGGGQTRRTREWNGEIVRDECPARNDGGRGREWLLNVVNGVQSEDSESEAEEMQESD